MTVSGDARSAPERRFCPYLVGLDADDRQVAPQDYPSFENHCLVAGSRHAVVLTHQATFCLGAGHPLCPRYQALHDSGYPQTAGEATEDVAVDSGSWTALPWGQSFAPPRRPVAMWLWVGLALAVLLVVGGGLAAYSGWQLANQGALGSVAEVPPAWEGAVSVAPPSELPMQLVTATPTLTLLQPDTVLVVPGGSLPAAPLPGVTQPTPFVFPPAVTPTPLPPGVLPGDLPEGGLPLVITTPTPPVGGSLLQPIPEIPTRRPTPTFEVPTSTPLPQPSATSGPPAQISFGVAHQSLPSGSCTTFYWDVANVRAVFFEEQGVDGKGEARACMDDGPLTRTLSVLLQDGREESRTLTVDRIVPTPTPTQTPTFTPVLTPTPTWTPERPPDQTPVPDVRGVALVVEGGNQRRCQPGAECTVYLGLVNTGSVADELFLVVTSGGPWPVQLCRQDGPCGESYVSLGVAAGQQATLELRVRVPAEAAGQRAGYVLQGESGGSQRTVKSEPLSVTIDAG